MTEREKLISILQRQGEDGGFYESADIIADFLLANGVILPPVKVGDPVFRIDNWNGEHIAVGKISMIKQKSDFTWSFRGVGKGFEGSKDFTITDIGTTVFLTRKDAEKALNEQKK